MTATFRQLDEIGGCIPAGEILVFSGSYPIDGDTQDRVAELVRKIDAQLKVTAFQAPKGSDWETLCDILQAAIPENETWEARIGTNNKWDVRLTVKKSGFMDWNRCRQGWLESSQEFWQ